MKFFFKCVSVFIALTALLILVSRLWLNISLPFSGLFLYSAFTSLLLTLLYGWIDAVYIQQRQPELQER